MKIGYYEKSGSKRLGVIPECDDDVLCLDDFFPNERRTKIGSISLPYSMKSFTRIHDNIEIYSLSKKAELPVLLLSKKCKLINYQRKELSYIYNNTVQSFIDSGFSDNLVPELDNEFDPIVDPYAHQQVALSYMLQSYDIRGGFALFFDMGIGKTYTTLNFIEYLFEQELIKKVLVIAPFSTIKGSWCDDIDKFCGLSRSVIYSSKASGKYKERDIKKQCMKNSHIYITNYGTLRSKYFEMITDSINFDCIVIDESARIKNPKSLTFKKIKELCSNVDIEYKFCLNGTPSPRGILDLWSQFNILDNGLLLGENYKQFEDEYTVPVRDSKHQRSPRKGAYKALYEKIRPFMLVFKKEDVLDLPPRTHILKLVDMSNKSRKVYDEMEKEGIVSIESKDSFHVIDAPYILSKLQKLRQIISGFLYISRDSREVIDLEPSKIDVISDLVNGIVSQNNSDKVVIWGTYKHEMSLICNMLKSLKIKYAQAYGGHGAGESAKNIDLFVNNANIRVMVASRSSIGVGVNLQVANYVIYSSLDEDLMLYLQSLDRIYRIGQKKKCICYYIVSRNSYEERIVSSLRKKKSVQDYLMQGEFSREKLRNPNIINEWKTED